MESVLLYGTPHSAGLMFQNHTTIGRLTSIVQHYQNLKNVELLDVLGAAAFIQETDVFGVRLASLDDAEQNKEPVVIFIKARGNDAFAEDGGKPQSFKKSSKGGKGKASQWNKWPGEEGAGNQQG